MERRVIKGILEVLFSLMIIVGVLVFSDRIIQLKEFGYLGVFLISLLSAATVFIPAPGWAVVIALGGILNPYLVGFFAGVGSAIGEITGYLMGNGLRSILKKRFPEATEKIKRYDLVAVFFLALIPNPFFDIAGLISGAIRLPLWKFLFATMTGRIVRYVLLAYFSAWTLSHV